VFIVEPLQCLLLLLQLVLLPLLLALQLEVGQFVVDLLEHVFDAHVLVLALCEQFERFFTGLVLDTSACHLLEQLEVLLLLLVGHLGDLALLHDVVGVGPAETAGFHNIVDLCLGCRLALELVLVLLRVEGAPDRDFLLFEGHAAATVVEDDFHEAFFHLLSTALVQDLGSVLRTEWTLFV